MNESIDSTAAEIARWISAIPAEDAVVGFVRSTQPNPAPPTWEAFVAAFTTEADWGTPHVRAWTVQYGGESREAVALAPTTRIFRVTRRWIVRLHLSWADTFDSESTFRGLMEEAADAIDAHSSMGAFGIDHTPAQIDVPNDGAGIFLGDVLCHYGEIRFSSTHEIGVAQE